MFKGSMSRIEPCLKGQTSMRFSSLKLPCFDNYNHCSEEGADLVVDYFYLFPSEQQTRQRIGALLGINVIDPSYLDNEAKKLKP